MGWIGKRFVGGDLTPPYYDPAIGEPDTALVPQWPTQYSRRTAGEWRWLTESKRRPMTQRLLCKLEYSRNDPALQGGVYDLTEYCWVGLFSLDPFVLSADSGVSPYGSRICGQLVLDHDTVGEQPTLVSEEWLITTPRSDGRFVQWGPSASLDWNKPSQVFTVGPMNVCPVCNVELPDRMGVDVDGVAAAGDMVPIRDLWANGVYLLPKASACRYFRTSPDGKVQGDPYSVTYSFVFREDTLSNVGRVHLTCSGSREEMGFIETAKADFVSAEFPLTSGNFDCLGELPITMTLVPGTNFPLPTWDWGGSVIKIVDAAGEGGENRDAFPYKRLTTRGFSECYPIETFTKPDANQGNDVMSEELVGVLAGITPSQSLDGGVDLNFDVPTREVGGIWWDPQGNANELIVPAPFNFIRVLAQIYTGTPRQNFISVTLRINGSGGFIGFFGQYSRSTNQAQNAALNASSDWIPIATGDKISLRASQGSGTTDPTPGISWIRVEARYLVV